MKLLSQNTWEKGLTKRKTDFGSWFQSFHAYWCPYYKVCGEAGWGRVSQKGMVEQGCLHDSSQEQSTPRRTRDNAVYKECLSDPLPPCRSHFWLPLYLWVHDWKAHQDPAATQEHQLGTRLSAREPSERTLPTQTVTIIIIFWILLTKHLF